MNYAQHFSPNETPQTERARPEQVKNNAGGYVFALDKFAQLERWLILGSEGGTYYCSEQKLTRENCQTVMACLHADPARTVDTIVKIREENRAPRHDPAIFALALAYTSPLHSPPTPDALLAVCKTGTQILQFVAAIKSMRGIGRRVGRHIAAWYLTKTPRNLAYQVTKYQNRAGWSHRDVLRQIHAQSETHEPVFRYVFGGLEALGGRKTKYREFAGVQREDWFEYLEAVEEMKTASVTRAIVLIEKHNLSHEMVPTELQKSPEIWDAMLPKLGYTALMRSLARMTANGAIGPMSNNTQFVTKKLADVSEVKAARVHPVNLLMALRTYSSGHGDKGKLAWSPIASISDALENAFYESFRAIEPSGKRIYLGIDVSGSMYGKMQNSSISCAEGAFAMAMATIRVEANYHVAAFDTGMVPVPMTRTTSIRNIADFARLWRSGGATDCAKPMLDAMEKKIPVDTFSIYTDNETWAGKIHPCQALKQYRDKMGINAKLVVTGMTSTGFTIADPTDPLTMDVVGFDSAAPALISDFCR